MRLGEDRRKPHGTGRRTRTAGGDGAPAMPCAVAPLLRREAHGRVPRHGAGKMRDERGVGRVLAGRSARRPAAGGLAPPRRVAYVTGMQDRADGGGRRQAWVAAALCVGVAGRGTGVWEPRIWAEGDGLMER